jgi:hypothetical protein
VASLRVPSSAPRKPRSGGVSVAGEERHALDFASHTLSSCAAVAVWPFVAILASALALVTALLVAVLVLWSLHDAPNYWRT